MNEQKLDEILSEIEALRRGGPPKPRELEAVAQKLGRRLHKRGKEPTLSVAGQRIL